MGFPLGMQTAAPYARGCARAMARGRAALVSMKRRQGPWTAAGFGALALAALVAAWPKIERLQAQKYRRDRSPDGRYAMVVYRIPTVFAMPGNSGGAPGYVQLWDTVGGGLAVAAVAALTQTDCCWGIPGARYGRPGRGCRSRRGDRSRFECGSRPGAR